MAQHFNTETIVRPELKLPSGHLSRLEFLWRWAPIVTLTLVAAALRLVSLGAAGFRIDEGFTLTCARQSWAGVMGLHGYYSLHPPLFFTMVKLANLVLPEVTASRAVAVTAGIATIPVFYVLCARLLDSRVAIGATTLLAISPLHIEFSRDGRMYAPIIFLVTTGWLALVSYMKTQDRRWAVLYAATVLLAFYTDYSAAFAVAPQVIVLGIYFVSVRREAAWLIGSVAIAALLYLPWVPQVYRGVDRSSGNPGREDWLSASWAAIGESIGSLLGFIGRTVTAGGGFHDVWHRWPDLRWPLIVIALLVPLVGLVALRKLPIRSALMAVVMAVTPPLAAIMLSQVSPGYAPRTVMASLLGITILSSAFLMRQPLSPILRTIGGAGWLYLVVISLVTLPVTYEVGARSEWPVIANDLANQSTLGKPIIIYSTAGMLTDMVDLYAGDRLSGVKIITLQDGQREKTIGYHRWADRGYSLAEVKAGVLGTLLPPGDPGSDAVWVILRFGGGQIPRYLNDLGYQQVGRFKYTDTVLYLYARPGAQLGEPVAVDNTFQETGDATEGWDIPESKAVVRPTTGAETATREMVMVADHGSATFTFPVENGGLVAVEAEIQSDGADARIAIRCVGPTGERLGRNEYTIEDSGSSAGWRQVRVAGQCPKQTGSVSVTFQRTGNSDVGFRSVDIQYNSDGTGEDS